MGTDTETTESTEGTEVTLKIRAFPYYVDYTDPVTGEERKQEKVARRGDKVVLSDHDYRRALHFDAVLTEADVAAREVTGDEDATIETMTVEQLAEWLKNAKPTVDQVLDEVNEDPALAARMLEAENLATGQDPRTTLETALEEIVEGE